MKSLKEFTKEQIEKELRKSEKESDKLDKSIKNHNEELNAKQLKKEQLIKYIENLKILAKNV